MTVSELVAPGRELVPHRAVLDAAEHVLVIARGRPYGPEQAFHELLSVALAHRIEVLTLARALIAVSESRDHGSIPTDTAHAVAVLEWGVLLEIPADIAAQSQSADLEPSTNAGVAVADPVEAEYLVETDAAGRIIFVALAFTVGTIVGFFAHTWIALLVVTCVYLIWITSRLVVKLVRTSRSGLWEDDESVRSTESDSLDANRSRRHAVAA